MKGLEIANGDRKFYKIILYLCAFLFFGCSSDTTSVDVETTELKSFETIISVDENVLATPVIIKQGDESCFFIYDVSQGQIFEFDYDGTVLKKIGRAGRGPGEYLLVNNLFVTKQNLYLTDTAQLLAHKYDRQGNLLSTFDFGKIAGQPTVPPPGVGTVTANEIDNQPYVTLQGDIILSNVNVGEENESIFQLIGWEKENKLSELGEVPTGSDFILDNEKLRSEASAKKIPSFYKANSFPLQDRANPDEYFIIYSSLPKIAKYASNGDKIWEREINNAEVEDIKARFFEVMDEMSKSSDIRDRVELEFYSSGKISEEGELYLVANTKPVMIHQFNNSGELVQKYVFSTEDVTPVLDFNYATNRILAATEDGEIRSYFFK